MRTAGGWNIFPDRAYMVASRLGDHICSSIFVISKPEMLQSQPISAEIIARHIVPPQILLWGRPVFSPPFKSQDLHSLSAALHEAKSVQACSQQEVSVDGLLIHCRMIYISRCSEMVCFPFPGMVIQSHSGHSCGRGYPLHVSVPLKRYQATVV